LQTEWSGSPTPAQGAPSAEWKSADADLIILITDANRAQSLSGYTPLLVPVTR
jgi:hypothetical protein